MEGLFQVVFLTEDVTLVTLLMTFLSSDCSALDLAGKFPTVCISVPVQCYGWCLLFFSGVPQAAGVDEGQGGCSGSVCHTVMCLCVLERAQGVSRAGVTQLGQRELVSGLCGVGLMDCVPAAGHPCYVHIISKEKLCSGRACCGQGWILVISQVFI